MGYDEQEMENPVVMDIEEAFIDVMQNDVIAKSTFDLSQSMGLDYVDGLKSTIVGLSIHIGSLREKLELLAKYEGLQAAEEYSKHTDSEY